MQRQLGKWPGWYLNPELSNCKAHVASVALGTQPRGKEQTLMVVTEHPWGAGATGMLQTRKRLVKSGTDLWSTGCHSQVSAQVECSPASSVPQVNVSFKTWLNCYLQRIFPDGHMAGLHPPLPQPNFQHHQCLSLPSHISCFKGKAEEWL